MPHVARTTSGRVAVIGVDSNETSTATADRLLATAGATYPVAVDAQATVASHYLVQALPVTYFLNASGQVVGVRSARRASPRWNAGRRASRDARNEISEAEAGSAPRPPRTVGSRSATPPIDRSAALAEGAPGIPLKFVYWGLGVVLVLSWGV